MNEPDNVRAQFEAWAILRGWELKRFNDMPSVYVKKRTCAGWDAWQAAQQATKESK